VAGGAYPEAGVVAAGETGGVGVPISSLSTLTLHFHFTEASKLGQLQDQPEDSWRPDTASYMSALVRCTPLSR
jgi:hypothetical protein